MTSRNTQDASARADIYTEVTNRIIADLERGIAPWAKPWKAGEGAAMPANAVTGRRYSGVNVLILWGAAQAAGFNSSRWLTFNQARDAGGSVRKGSKGTAVVYASSYVPDRERERADAAGEDARSVAFLRRFTVFNLDQCEGLSRFDHETTWTGPQQHDAAEDIIEASGIPFAHGGDRAFYSPSHDRIQMPPRAAFADHLDYYRTAFHELIHSTGHASRLDRTFGKRFGDAHYAREELCAEIGAAFVCATIGVEPTVRHADYIGHWLSVLREDNRAIFRAASAASKAADYLLNLSRAELAEAA